MDIEIIKKIKEEDKQKILSRKYAIDNLLSKTGGMIRSKTLTSKEIKFHRLPERIAEMDSGKNSFTLTTVYNEYRLSDWLPMPTEAEINNNEIYILFHVPVGANSLLSFKVTTENGSRYNVKYGKMVDGVINYTNDVYINSGTSFDEKILDSIGGSTTANGMNQIMFKISVEDETDNIITFETTSSQYRTSPVNFRSWNIVEISAKLPHVNTIDIGTKTTKTYTGLNKLKFFSLYGTNNITNFDNMFAMLQSLIAIRALDTSKGISFQSMLSGCRSLMLTNEFDLINATNTLRMFQNCTCLLKVSIKNIGDITDCTRMFSYCHSLSEIKNLNFNSITSATAMFIESGIRKITNCNFAILDAQMFENCVNLINLENCNFTEIKSTNRNFYGCVNLIEIPTFILPDNNNSFTMSNTFDSCRNLKEIVVDLNHHTTILNNTFRYCTSLQKITILNGEEISSLNSAFLDCYALISIQGLETSKCTDFYFAFYRCRSLCMLKNIDISAMTNDTYYMFDGCFCLGSLTFKNVNELTSSKTGKKYSIKLNDCSFNKTAIINLFNSLPTISKSNKNTYELVLTNNRGVSSLTEEDIKIATNKKWIITC